MQKILFSIIIVLGVAISVPLYAPQAQFWHTKPAFDNPIMQYIVYHETLDVESALRIAQCESNLDPYAQNPNSSAKGLFQFIDSTWDNYCQGDVYSYQDNIECFAQLYPQHQSWWECK